MARTSSSLLVPLLLVLPAGVARGQTDPTFVLCDPASHPEAARSAERAERRRLLADGGFDELAAALDRVRAEGRREGDCERELDDALARLADPSGVSQLDAWCAARPEDAWAFLLRGQAGIHHAWEARGSGWASSVTEDGWRLFGERLALARERLLRAAELRPGWPEPHASLVAVAVGLSLPASEARAAFERAVAADPGHLPAYRALLDYLAPRWHGSREAMFGFTREAIAAHPDEPALALLVPDAHWSMAPGREVAYMRARAILSETTACVARALDAYPRSPAALWWRVRLAEALAPDHGARIDALSRLSELGDATAQRALGSLLLEGQIVARDGPRALRLLCRAAHRGEVMAQCRLAQCLADGEVVARDEALAVVWYRRAAEAGFMDAMTSLAFHLRGGRGTARDVAGALVWCRRAAEQGNLWAMAEAGEILALGAPGVPRDLAESRRWLDLGVAQESARCLRFLARYHVTDAADVAELYRRAIRAGSRPAVEDLRAHLAAHPDLRRAGDP